jgi:hypothetical protein
MFVVHACAAGSGMGTSTILRLWRAPPSRDIEVTERIGLRSMPVGNR